MQQYHMGYLENLSSKLRAAAIWQDKLFEGNLEKPYLGSDQQQTSHAYLEKPLPKKCVQQLCSADWFWILYVMKRKKIPGYPCIHRQLYVCTPACVIQRSRILPFSKVEKFFSGHPRGNSPHLLLISDFAR